jgi:hypothetical protein
MDTEVREPVVVERPVVAVEDNDLLSWGSIWAGLLTAFAVFVVLSLAAVAAGLQADPGADVQFRLGREAALIISGLFVVVAFFAGGFVASWSARLDDPEPAALHGFLVWALWLMLLLVLAGLGAGQVLGIAAQIFAPQFAPGADVNVDAGELLSQFRDASWQMLFAIVLAAASSVLGAVLATNDDLRARIPRYRW